MSSTQRRQAWKKRRIAPVRVGASVDASAVGCASFCLFIRLALSSALQSIHRKISIRWKVWRALPSELRPTAIDRKFHAGREGRIEPKEEDRLRDFLRRPPALHRDHTGHLLPNLGGLVFTAKHFADDRRVDGTG